MKRRKKMDANEVMAATEELLLEKGFEGFHFKALSTKLGIGRSTIYDYFNNKEELIVIYIEKMLTEIMLACEEISGTHSTEEKIRALLHIFMNYPLIPLIIQILPTIDPKQSELINKTMERLDRKHSQLLEFTRRIIQAGKESGELRSEIPNEIMEQLLFNIIQIPRYQYEKKDWADLLFNVLANGISTKPT